MTGFGHQPERQTSGAESKRDLRQQAALLDLAPVAIVARDMAGHITGWNRGAQQLYGWSPEHVLGQAAHDLLQTVFPTSRQDLSTALLEHGNWAGELRHQTRSGAQVVVASGPSCAASLASSYRK